MRTDGRTDRPTDRPTDTQTHRHDESNIYFLEFFERVQSRKLLAVLV
jgi:hypothetical protein